ncbi:MAG: DUF2141 domain-containing protein [Bacteroidia bacterium]|nr:DUF2141 domain-containing protein [Bacteroidia bacterium]
MPVLYVCCLMQSLFISLLICSTMSFALGQAPATGTVELTIRNIRNNQGKILIGVYVDTESFHNKIAFKKVHIGKETLRDGVLTTTISLEPGIYGISLMDDENYNRLMDFNLIGIPTEGFGFSNYYHRGFTQPPIEAFQFEVKAGMTRQVEVIMRYL